ncbi:MAG: response regulator transcription factor [Gemmatimonadota bacterium]
MSETKPAPEEVVLVALVDDNRISREEHARLLDAHPNVTVVSAEATLRVTMLTEEQPDVVLVDAGTTEAESLNAAVTMRRVLPDAGVVITDLMERNEDIADYVKAGVSGFVLKEATGDDVVDTVERVAHGAHVLPNELTSPLFVQIAAEGIVIDEDPPGPPVRANVAITLTLREKEVVALLGEGLANKAIGARLFISTDTVKSHIRNAMVKTGLHTRILLATSTKAPPKPRSPR